MFPVITIILFFSGLTPELSSSEPFVRHNALGSLIEFRINDTVLDIGKGIESDTKSKISIHIADEKTIIQNSENQIGVEVTLAKGIRPIRNADGLETRVFSSYKLIEGYQFEELIFPAKEGDRIILKFTNTKEELVYSIDLI